MNNSTVKRYEVYRILGIMDVYGEKNTLFRETTSLLSIQSKQ